MWKESLRIGVDLIDEQHKNLFDRVGELLENLNDEETDRKQECISAILFLKDYAVKHFAAEEAYQKSVNYPHCESHKKLHENFVKTVLAYEQKMAATDFRKKEIREFTGMLSTWLLYHVADVDQGIVKEAAQAPDEKRLSVTNATVLQLSVSKVLETLAALDPAKVLAVTETPEAETADVGIELSGARTGSIRFAYTIDFVKNLVQAMLNYRPEAIQELETSVLMEMSNIIGGTVCQHFAEIDGTFSEVGVPYAPEAADIKSGDEIVLDTGIGFMKIYAAL